MTITIDDDLVAEIDAFMTGHGCADRSEAIGGLARSGVSQPNLKVVQDRYCAGTLSDIYDNADRGLCKRMTQDFHANQAPGHTGRRRDRLPTAKRRRS